MILWLTIWVTSRALAETTEGDPIASFGLIASSKRGLLPKSSWPDRCVEMASKSVAFDGDKPPRLALIGDFSPISRTYHVGHAAAIYTQMRALRFLFGDRVVGAGGPRSVCGEVFGEESSVPPCLVDGCRDALTSADLVVATPAIHWLHEPPPSVVSTFSLVKYAKEKLGKTVWTQASFHPYVSQRLSREDDEGADAAHSLASFSDWFVARDHLSAEWIQHYVPDHPAQVAVDLTFLLPYKVDQAALDYLPKQLPRSEERFSIIAVATALPSSREGTRHVVLAALVEACELRPRRAVTLIEYRHGSHFDGGSETLKDGQRVPLLYESDVARLVKTGICAEGSETKAYWPHLDSFAQTILMFKAQDLIITGSFHVACFARLASVPAVVLPGPDSLSNEELVKLFRSKQDYLALRRDELLSSDTILVKSRVKAFFHTPRSSQDDLENNLKLLRRNALSNLAPFAEACNNATIFETYFPDTASLALVKDQERFVAGKSTWIGWNNCTASPGDDESPCQSNQACFP